MTVQFFSVITVNQKEIELSKLNINQILLKSNSKKKAFRLLHLEGNFYLTPLVHANHNFVSELISKRKKVCIKAHYF